MTDPLIGLLIGLVALMWLVGGQAPVRIARWVRLSRPLLALASLPVVIAVSAAFVWLGARLRLEFNPPLSEDGAFLFNTFLLSTMGVARVIGSSGRMKDPTQ